MNKFKQLLVVLCLVLFSFPTVSFAFSLSSIFSTENSEVNLYESRLQAWQTLIKENKNSSDWQKINKVNQFFNRVNFVEDNSQWGVEDYWASPREFLTRNAGDCEDYAIAKYFTLKAMGVPVTRLRITYVTTLPSQQAHMVLVYLEGADKTPLVLDNLQKAIVSFSERVDLDPVYSFNNNGLWLAYRDMTKAQLVGSTQQVGHWQVLSDKMSEERVL